MSGPAGIINAFAQATAVLPVGDDGAGRYSARFIQDGTSAAMPTAAI